MSIFSQFPAPKLKHSVFKLSHQHKFSCNFGELLPVLSIPIVPGDKFKLQSTLINRMAPMVAPVMHQIKDYMHYFFVPFSQLVPRRYLDKLLSGGSKGTDEQVFPSTRIIDLIKLSAEYYYNEKLTCYYVGDSHYYLGVNSLANYLGLKLTFTHLSSSNASLSDDFKSKNQYYAVVDAKVVTNTPINLFPFLAYQKAYIDWYRDANYLPEFTYDDGIFRFLDNSSHTWQDVEVDGRIFDSDNYFWFLAAVFGKHNRAYHKDYFTSALPFPQRGPEVSVPLNGVADVNIPSQSASASIGLNSGATATNGNLYYHYLTPNGIRDVVDISSVKTSDGNAPDFSGSLLPAGALYYTSEGKNYRVYTSSSNSSINIRELNGKADISQGGFTVYDLRRAESLQRFFERSARSGWRYFEQLVGFFSEVNKELTLNRPQFLGGGSDLINISDVLQTAPYETDSYNSAVGNMTGFGYTSGSCGFGTQKFKQFGYVIGLFSILPRMEYATGIDKDLLKHDRYDLFFPDFANLGEQEISSLELSAQGTPVTFGYTPRYAEYKFMRDRVSGEFATPGLSSWHLAKFYEGAPVNGTDFFECKSNDDLNRIFAVQSDTLANHFYINCMHNIRAVRPMPFYGVPHL